MQHNESPSWKLQAVLRTLAAVCPHSARPACSDDILLEVTFAATWLAAVLQSAALRRNTWQEYHLEHLSTPVLMLLKWVLFKLLLISATFSAGEVCAAAPALHDCYRALAAHGQPTALTRCVCVCWVAR
jgi:hypothetical protein